MTYPAFVPTTPTATQTLSDFAASFRENATALRDALLYGGMPATASYSMSQAGGSSIEPTEIIATAGSEILHAFLTWSSGNISAMNLVYGTTNTASTVTLSYDASGEVTAVTNAGIGMFAKLYPLLAKYKTLRSQFDTHKTAAGAHSIGTFATQNTTAITCTGGNASGVTVGSLTAANVPINATYSREGAAIYGVVSGGNTLIMDIGSAGWLECTVTGTSSIAPATISTSGSDLNSNYLRTQTLWVSVVVPTGAGTQFLNWAGYNWIGLSQQELTANARHMFILTQRTNTLTTVKVMEYIGVVI